MTTKDGTEGNLFSTAGRSLRQAAAAGLGLLALAFISGSLGNLSRALDGVLAVGALLSLAVLWPQQTQQTRCRRPRDMVLALALMATALPIVAWGEPLGLLGAALFFFALSLLAPEDDGTATVLLLTALLFALYRTWVAGMPLLWYTEQWASIYFSWFTGAGLMLGPTALGLPLFV